MPKLPEDEDRIESPPAPRRPWVPPALTHESVDHTAGKYVADASEMSMYVGPAS
jgi:hypothetical protein